MVYFAYLSDIKASFCPPSSCCCDFDFQTPISNDVYQFITRKKRYSFETYLALTIALAAFSEESVHGRKNMQKNILQRLFQSYP